MYEKFLVLMADLDDQTQNIMSEWYGKLQKSGYIGKQTPNIPYHISLATFSVNQENEAIEEVQRLGKISHQIPVHLSHIGIFAGGKVLYAAPDMNPSDLLNIRNEIRLETKNLYEWTPHATILLDEPEIIKSAVRIMIDEFTPIKATVKSLHLCEFWPVREIINIDLKV